MQNMKTLNMNELHLKNQLNTAGRLVMTLFWKVITAQPKLFTGRSALVMTLFWKVITARIAEHPRIAELVMTLFWKVITAVFVFHFLVF